jgi:hypothetical protein
MDEHGLWSVKLRCRVVSYKRDLSPRLRGKGIVTKLVSAPSRSEGNKEISSGQITREWLKALIEREKARRLVRAWKPAVSRGSSGCGAVRNLVYGRVFKARKAGSRAHGPKNEQG